ncbi:MAG: M48 family metallopeptidase [Nanoarchaeota archaeon]
MPEYQRIDFRDQISRNKWQSFFLMAIIFAIIIALAYVISYVYDPAYSFFILIIAIIFSMIYILISYYNSDKIAIASVSAKEAKQSEYRDYHNLVEGISIASGLPKPRLYIMESNQINAFASGRDPEHAVICATTGALEKLDRRELEGVLSHEMSHIANFDIRYMTFVAVMVGMIAIISEIFLRSLWMKGNDREGKSGIIIILIGVLLAILAPIVVKFVQFAISRKREYSADASAVKFTRYPKGLINALKKIQQDYKSPEENKKVPKAVAPLFFANPFKNLTSTHPPINERIRILESM